MCAAQIAKVETGSQVQVGAPRPIVASLESQVATLNQQLFPDVRAATCFLVHFTVSAWQALGIPYHACGVSELNENFQKVIRANFRPEHLHRSLRDQVEQRTCLLHMETGGSCGHKGCDLCVCGSPCPPFSVQRVKRFCDGSIASHALTSVTTEDARDMLLFGQHRAFILEQVAGFDMPEVAGGSSDETPMRRRGPVPVRVLHSQACHLDSSEATSLLQTL